MFINVSNHPSANWGAEQYKAALQMGQIIDLPFPAVDPSASREEVTALAQSYYGKVCALTREQGTTPEGVTVMVSGEFTFTYHLVTMLLQSGYRVVSACTRRDAVEQLLEDGSIVKTARFSFVQFREY